MKKYLLLVGLLSGERLLHPDAFVDELADRARRVAHPASGGFGRMWST